jgi:hypothetical protein
MMFNATFNNISVTVGGQKYSTNMASVIWKIKIAVKER